jgi:hypothetical protein
MLILTIALILYYIVSVGWLGYYLISDSYESDELTVAGLIGYILFVPIIGPFFFPIFAGERLSRIKIRKRKDNKPYYQMNKNYINEELND